MSPRPPSLTIDTKNDKLLKSVSVGDDVVFEVRGKVTGIQAPSKGKFGDTSETFPGHVSMTLSDVKKRKAGDKEIEKLDEMFTDEED